MTNTDGKLTSTTAPGKIFSSRAELADHYKSDWHKYNLKRREANLPMLQESDFKARWEAALALRQEKQQQKNNNKGTHLKKGKKKKNNNNHNKNDNQKSSVIADQSTTTTTQQEAATTTVAASVTTAEDEDDIKEMEEDEEPKLSVKERIALSQENPEIHPKQSLFDPHMSESLQENVNYMQKKYGFFIPDKECLVDLEGLLGYCHEKIKLGHYCLYCEKMFPTWQGCQQHMINKQHTKLRYEKGYWEELDLFYDFHREDDEFITSSGLDNNDDDDDGDTDEKMDVVVVEEEEEDGMSDDDDDDDEYDDDEYDDEEMYRGYEREIARFGLDVTSLGELVFPDGRIIGHRALNKYYKQRIRPERTQQGNNNTVAVNAAIEAAGERIYEGRVIQLNNIKGQLPLGAASGTGIGKGILVSSQKDGGAATGFSSLSLYRYRAAVLKQRREDDKGRRLKLRTTRNINRMDKKANRLMNGVSVAHAAR